MRSRLHAIVIAAALAAPHAVIVAQPLNPPYLSEMPSVTRVKAEIKGSDPVDTSARQTGALWQLMEVINTLAGPRFRSLELTPDEDRVKRQYFGAWQQYQTKDLTPAQDEPRWRKLRAQYETDSALHDELLQRFFSPAFRTAYFQTTGTPAAQLSAGAPPATAPRAAAQPAASPAQPPATRPAAPPTPKAPNDPDPGLVAKAEQGDAEAQYKLGDYYFKKPDRENGMKWTRKAAEQGHAAAQHSLGFRYQKGDGIPKNVPEARKWYRMSQAQGLRAAWSSLCESFAESLELGRGAGNPNTPITSIAGGKADVAEAFQWCSLAAEHGEKFSQYRLGILYGRGNADVKLDYSASFFWLSMALPISQDFRVKVGKNLTAEQRAEIEKQARAWKYGTPPPFAPPKG